MAKTKTTKTTTKTAKKKPPAIAALTWSVREVLDPGTPVTSLACAQGVILVGGARLYRVAPGGWNVQRRGLPEGTEMPISVAVEPRSPFRVAAGPPSGDVIVFTDTLNASSIIGHGFSEVRGSRLATQLAWVVNDGQSSLFARTDDGGLYRMQTEGWDSVEMPPVRAIASDDTGGFAALTVVDGEPKVYVTRDGGDHFQFRSLGVDVEAEPNAPAFLALAGTAVAVVVGESGPLVSRGAGLTTTHYDGLERTYALAFQGPAPDAWLYAAVQRQGKEPAAIWLLDADGNRVRVIDLLAEDQQPLDLGPIAWDPARGALMVSSRGGLLAIGPELDKLKPKRPRAQTRAIQ